MQIYPLIDLFALKQDGSTPLTGNWNVGGFNITGIEELSAVDLTLTTPSNIYALLHNSFSTIQGGQANPGQYYHLTYDEHSELTSWLSEVTLDGFDGGIQITGGGSFIGNVNTTSIASATTVSISPGGGGGPIIFSKVGAVPQISTAVASGIDLRIIPDGANINISTKNLYDGTNTVTVAEAATAYTHSQDNTQAHSDYLLNSGSDSSSGTITAAGFTTTGAGRFDTGVGVGNAPGTHGNSYLDVVAASGGATLYVESASGSAAGFACQRPDGIWARLHSATTSATFLFENAGAFRVTEAAAGANPYDENFPGGKAMLIISSSVTTFNEPGEDVDFRVETDLNTHALFVDGGNDNVTINGASVSVNYDLGLVGDGVLMLKEGVTPTADTDYGKVYCKNDNLLYFQDGAGTEHQLAFA